MFDKSFLDEPIDLTEDLQDNVEHFSSFFVKKKERKEDDALVASDLHQFFILSRFFKSNARSTRKFSSMFSIITLINWICVSLFILGFIGNLLGLIVFSSRRFRCCSTYSTLALTSFTVNLICIIRYSFLLHSTTRRWLSDHFVGLHWLTCKIYRSSSSVRVIAAWVTVFWVIERFVYVSSRLNLMFKQKFHCHYIDHYRYALMIIFCTIMIFLITGPTVYFYSPIMIR